MNATSFAPSTASSAQPSRPNLNQAANRVAAAFGLTIKRRSNMAPAAERMHFTWTCQDEATGANWDMELVCLPVLWGQEGWIGSLRISRYGVQDLVDCWFVSCDERLYGRQACKLTRERFCAWAFKLEPGSRVRTGATKQELSEAL